MVKFCDINITKEKNIKIYCWKLKLKKILKICLKNSDVNKIGIETEMSEGGTNFSLGQRHCTLYNCAIRI